MRRAGIVLATLIVLTVFATGSGSGATAPSTGAGFVVDEVLVNVKVGSAITAVVQAVGGRIADYLDGVDVYLVKVPAGTVPSVVAMLNADPRVRFAEPNWLARLFLDPDDPYDNTTCYPASNGSCVSQWAWEKLQAYQAWDVPTGDGLINVAVVDTGIDVGNPGAIAPDPTGHEDLVSCRPVIVQNFVITESSNDQNGHGTHVAGTIGACTNNATGIAGASPSVQLLGVKVLDYTGSGTYAAVADGIRWAADAGAKVINISLGGSQSSRTLERALNYAWNKGAVLVCAAGNNGTTVRFYPAAYDRCIAVAATDQTDAIAPFSSYGADWVDVAAPGVNIVSTMQDSFDSCFLCYWFGITPGYDAMDGTSMAAPHVAGLAALIWAQGGCASNTCVRNTIESTADQIPGSGVYWKYGRVNFASALK